MVIGIIFILAIISFVVVKEYKSAPTTKGKAGEWRVHNILSQLPEGYFVFDDVVLGTNGGTTQIDHVVVSKYGVFAIETKNYRGEIYGNDDWQEWTQKIKTNVTYWKKWYKTYTYVKKSRFYNPVSQSLGHVRAIERVLKEWPSLRVVPIVVFAGSANLSHVSSQHHVIYGEQLLSVVLSYDIPYLTDADVNRIVACLAHNNVRGQVDTQTHLRNVYAAKQYKANKVASGICPQCGGALVHRSGRYGSFYGCSNYPRCRFTTQ